MFPCYFRPSSCFIFLFALTAASCGTSYYRPRPSDPPLLTEAGQVKVAGLAGLSVSGGGTLRAAWSPVKGLGLQAGYTGSGELRSEASGNEITVSDQRRNSLFLGAGYYRTSARGLHWEIYGGAGSFRYRDDSAGLLQRLALANYYLEPAVGIVKERFELAFSLRYDLLQRGRTAFRPLRPGELLPAFTAGRTYHFLQPGITFRSGGPNVQFLAGLYQSFALQSSYRALYGTRSLHGSAQYLIGVNLNLHALLR